MGGGLAIRIGVQEDKVSNYQWVPFDYEFKDVDIKEVIRKIIAKS